ncbi:HET-domain-containing protein [Xylaria acuta]|nr:HET-domain-containing protein [Xylaria acuta]
MENLTNHGATLLGQRLGSLANGIIVANVCNFIAYVVFDHLFRARRSDTSLAASKSTWRIRLPMFSAWLGMCMAYITWVPNRRLINMSSSSLIYHGMTGRGLNLLLWSGIAIQKDGPRDLVNKAQVACLDAMFSFLVSSCSLTHRAVGIPLLCISGVLYYFREVLPLSRTYYHVRYYVFLFVTKAWDSFDYVEAQIRHPERAKLPIYQYQPLNAGEIRLLILRRSPFYPSIAQVEIVHRPIYPPPDYEAVSYRWGSAELTEEILVDGCRFPVTKAAFDLLLARRSMWRERTIWIDTLCINQEDLQERANKLAGGFIYELMTMDWQGTPDEASSPRWRATADLFTNEYLNRAWVIQEIAVGQKTELYVGGIYIPWIVFADLLTIIALDQSRRRMLTSSPDKVRRIWRPGRTFENVATSEISRFGSLIDVEKLLYLTFNFRAADPRDKVFGLMGIAGNTGDTTLTAPDYSLPVEQVFQNTARAVSSLPSERRTVHILALAGIGFSERSRKMPSWVPDFSEERICYPASGDFPQDLWIDDEANSLVVKAITLGRVLDLGEYGALDWGLDDFEHFKTSSAADGLTFDRPRLACIGGLIERKPADLKFKDVFRHWWLNLGLWPAAAGPSLRLVLGEGLSITNSGRLSPVPPLTKVGDSAIVPLRSQTPFLIRQRDDVPGNAGYELVGEAWVEGVMYGEMIGNADEESIRIS